MDVGLSKTPSESKTLSGYPGCPSNSDAGIQCDWEALEKLRKERDDLQERLEFVEEIVGPTEAQRKIFQDQVLASRAAALRAKHHGAGVPTRVMGRLDERKMYIEGLSDRDVGLLQGGCLPNDDGILQDVSLLGDPTFRPYNQGSGTPKWEARGGALQLSLQDVKDRFGSDVALEVVRCAKELDDHDPSRRVGIELPWHPVEDRELQPAEIIDIMDREAGLEASFAEECLQSLRNINSLDLPSRRHHHSQIPGSMLRSIADEYDLPFSLGAAAYAPVPCPAPRTVPQQVVPGRLGEDFSSPYAEVIAPPRRVRSRRPPHGRGGSRSARGNASGASEASPNPQGCFQPSAQQSRGAVPVPRANNVVPLPRVNPAQPRTQDVRCLMPGPPRLRMPADMMGHQMYTGPCVDRMYHVY